MSDYDVLCKAIGTLAGGVHDRRQQAAQQYRPVVDDLLITGSRDSRLIERTLGRLLDFCGHGPQACYISSVIPYNNVEWEYSRSC